MKKIGSLMLIAVMLFSLLTVTTVSATEEVQTLSKTAWAFVQEQSPDAALGTSGSAKQLRTSLSNATVEPGVNDFAYLKFEVGDTANIDKVELEFNAYWDGTSVELAIYKVENNTFDNNTTYNTRSDKDSVDGEKLVFTRDESYSHGEEQYYKFYKVDVTKFFKDDADGIVTLKLKGERNVGNSARYIWMNLNNSNTSINPVVKVSRVEISEPVVPTYNQTLSKNAWAFVQEQSPDAALGTSGSAKQLRTSLSNATVEPGVNDFAYLKFEVGDTTDIAKVELEFKAYWDGTSVELATYKVENNTFDNNTTYNTRPDKDSADGEKLVFTRDESYSHGDEQYYKFYKVDVTKFFKDDADGIVTLKLKGERNVGNSARYIQMYLNNSDTAVNPVIKVTRVKASKPAEFTYEQNLTTTARHAVYTTTYPNHDVYPEYRNAGIAGSFYLCGVADDSIRTTIDETKTVAGEGVVTLTYNTPAAPVASAILSVDGYYASSLKLAAYEVTQDLSESTSIVLGNLVSSSGDQTQGNNTNRIRYIDITEFVNEQVRAGVAKFTVGLKQESCSSTGTNCQLYCNTGIKLAVVTSVNDAANIPGSVETLKVTRKVYSETAKTGIPFVALYNGDQLEKVSIGTSFATTIDGYTDINVDLELESGDITSESKIKLFFWSDFGTLIPLMEDVPEI